MRWERFADVYLTGDLEEIWGCLKGRPRSWSFCFNFIHWETAEPWEKKSGRLLNDAPIYQSSDRGGTSGATHFLPWPDMGQNVLYLIWIQGHATIESQGCLRSNSRPYIHDNHHDIICSLSFTPQKYQRCLEVSIPSRYSTLLTSGSSTPATHPAKVFLPWSSAG